MSIEYFTKLRAEAESSEIEYRKNTERKHHAFSPSTLQALEACPCYQGAQSTNEAAETGTRQHAVAESGTDDETLTDEQVEAVAEAMAFVARQKQILEKARTKDVNSFLAREGCTVAEAEAAVRPVIDLSEVYLTIDDEDTTAGTADRVLVSHDGKRAILIDHKFGKHAVEPAANNRQSDAYSLGVFHAYPSVERVQVFFFQPAVAHMNTEIWTRMYVPELLLRIKTIVARAKLARTVGDFSTAKPHIPVCLFCKHLGYCPPNIKAMLSIAKKFSPIEVDALDLTPTKVHEPAHAAAGMRLAGLVEAWAKAFKSLVLDRVLRGGEAPVGYELTSRATREIINVERFREIALAFISEMEYQSKMSPPALTVIEKLISDKSPRGQKTQTIEAFKAASEDAGAVQKRAPYAFLKAKTE